MKNRVVQAPSIVEPLQPSPGFRKKRLADYKLDILGLCGFGCRYCSSNSGNYLRIHRTELAELALQQLGERITPNDDPALTIEWPDVLDRLRVQLDRRRRTCGQVKTLVFSMLTDGFSPQLVARGVTEEALRLVLERTPFRVRVLTKNAVVGSRHWIDFFSRYPGRFVVGLSIGTLDDAWARRVEIGTSSPSARLRALHALQDAGVPTFGMLCPVFPDVLEADQLETMIDQIRPDRVEHIWAEPYNDRTNWRKVCDSYAVGSFGHDWFTAVYEKRNKKHWSAYASELYTRLRTHAEGNNWMHKLRYLLYEKDIAAEDAPRFRGLEGVLLQSKRYADGRSRNPHIAALELGTEEARER